jgi:hypothetical protein
MFIPVFNNVKYVDENGFLTDEMRGYEDLLNQSLQNGLSDNGWTLPQITAANLTSISSSMPNGTAWYETDAHEVVIKINGALRKVTTTVYP